MRVLILGLLLLPSLALAQDHRRAIESNLPTAVPIEGVPGKPLAQRMKELGVPALSYAVVEDGKVVLAAAYGGTAAKRLADDTAPTADELTWDSLADAYMLAGRTAEVIAASEEQLRRVDGDLGASAENKTFCETWRYSG